MQKVNIIVKKYGFILLLLFAAMSSFGQTIGQSEEKELYFKINFAYSENDTMIVFLNGTEGLGVQKGNEVTAYQAYEKVADDAAEKRDFKEIGSGRVVKSDSIVACMIKLNNAKEILKEGDMIALKVKIPLIKKRSIFSQLAFNNIYFVNNEKQKFYSLQDLVFNDGKKLVDSIYALMFLDCAATYGVLKDMKGLPESVTTTFKDGRFAGKTALEVIRDAKKDDIESFLKFVNDFPGKYMSNDFKLNETFATWLINDAAISPTEIKEALYPVYKNKKLFLEKLAPYKERIIEDSYCASYVREVTKFLDAGDYTYALDFNNFIKTVAYAVNDTAGKSLAWVFEAEIYQKQDKYAEAIIGCDSAIKYAQLANEHEYELAAISKKVYCLFRSMQSSRAKILLQEYENKIVAYKATLPEDVYNKNWQNRYEYAGSLYYEEGNYGEALSLYAKLIDLNKGINSYESIERNATYFTFIGRVNNDQGKPNNALDSFTKAAFIYKSNADTLNWAKVQNDMANSYYKLANYKKSMAYTDSALQKLLALNEFNDAGYSMSLKGSSYWSLGFYDSAVLAHQQSIQFRKKANNLSGQAFSWKSLGELYYLSGLKNKALIAYDSAAYFYQQLKDSSGLAETYNAKGNVYYNDENNKKAVELFEKAKGIDSKSTVEALYNLGNAWNMIDTVKARQYFDACIRLSDSTKNTGYQFSATWAQANLAYRTNNISIGNTLYENCLLLSKQLNTAQSYAECMALKGYGFKALTQLDSALKYFHQAKDIFDTTSQPGVINQLNNIADVHVSMGDFLQAKDAYNKAIELAKASNNNIALGATLDATSFLYGLTGEFEDGLKNSDSAQAIFERSGNIYRLANAYVSRGTLLKSMGKYTQSINSFLKSDSIYADQLAVESRDVVSNNIGVVYFFQEDYENALKYHRLALDQLKKGVYNESYFLYHGNIGEDLFYLKKYKEAEAEMLEVFPLAKEKKLNRITSGIALGLGKLYYETKQTDKALDYFNYAFEYANNSGEKEAAIEALKYLGQINNDQGKTANAETDFRKAVELISTYKIATGWEPCYQLGLLLFKQNKFDSAITYFKMAVDLLNKNAENLYGGDAARKIFNNDPRKSDLYSKITFSYFNTGNISEAWAYANRSNIAGIKELSGSISSSSNNEEKNEALKKLLSMQQEKKALENTLALQEGNAKIETLKKIEIQETKYTSYVNDMTANYPELGIYFAKTNADEFNGYKGQLPEDVAVVLYLLNNNNLMIFTLTNEKLSVDTMTIDVSKKITDFITSIKNTGKQTGTGALSLRSVPVDEAEPVTAADFKDISNELYNILIATIEDKIKGKKRLCIIPSGVFSNMPFQCLGKKTANNNFKFLIEEYSIFYTNKMSVFKPEVNNENTKMNMTSFAAFGVPDATLSYNISEVKEIGKILGSDSTVYADSRATESMAKKSLLNKKYIHFATHGVLNYSSDFLESYLKLLPDKDSSNGNNGHLTLREIQDLGISDCNMVILSACETAVSKQLIKGWNISPANSFLLSKVKTVVASLWKVADKPTGLLMQYFYENLSSSASMDKVEALRLAQIKLSQDPRFSHPNYWGAFVLYGDWR